jgi:DNA (cytosine-5)-methyltransferase 1
MIQAECLCQNSSRLPRSNFDKLFSYIDLFAGIGGLRLPFDELGGNCLMTCEIDNAAQQTYKLNFSSANPSGHIFHEDITTLPIELVPGHDLMLAGFPCQPFSHAGKRRGFDDTRGTMFFHVARIIDSKLPKMFLLENVRGLLSHDRGNTFSRIIEILSVNYEVQYFVLNAKDFGLPQNRVRVYILGLRKGLRTSDGSPIIEITPPKTPTRVGEILEENPDPSLTISDRLWASHKARKVAHRSRGNGWGYKLVDEESSHTSTLSARYYKDGAEILVAQKNSNPRLLSIQEAARLQGFPNGFKFCDSRIQAYKQLGNSVPVNVVRHIATAMSELLNQS